MNRSRNIPDISCVIPVFNCEAFLDRSITSVLKQTKKEIEIICVDDASTDHSPEKLYKFSEGDARITVLAGKNREGAAAARNRGLEKATGRYVIFLDSDDYFFPSMLEEVYRQAEQNEADMVVFGFEQQHLDEDGQITSIEEFLPVYEVVEKGERTEEYIIKLFSGPCNKLIKRELLNRNQITFQDIPAYNDVFYAYAAGVCSSKTVFYNKILMRYYCGRRGCLTVFRHKEENYAILAWDRLLSFIDYADVEESLRAGMYNYMVFTWITNQYWREEPEYGRRSDELLYRSEELLGKLEQAEERGWLYPYARQFMDMARRREWMSRTRYYDFFIPELRAFTNRTHARGKKIALWGYGKIGKRLMEGIEKYRIPIDYIIDTDTEKQQSRNGSFAIYGYEDVKDKVDVILVSTHKYFDSVKEMAKGKLVIDVLTGRQAE